jgi:hypothetical protein
MILERPYHEPFPFIKLHVRYYRVVCEVRKKRHCGQNTAEDELILKKSFFP